MRNLSGHMTPQFWHLWSLRIDLFCFNMVQKGAELISKIGKLYESQTLVDILVKSLVFQPMLKQALVSSICFLPELLPEL